MSVDLIKKVIDNGRALVVEGFSRLGANAAAAAFFQELHGY